MRPQPRASRVFCPACVRLSLSSICASARLSRRPLLCKERDVVVIFVPEEVAHVVLGRAGLEQPARELATQVVEVEMRNAGAGAGRRVPFF